MYLEQSSYSKLTFLSNALASLSRLATTAWSPLTSEIHFATLVWRFVFPFQSEWRCGRRRRACHGYSDSRNDSQEASEGWVSSFYLKFTQEYHLGNRKPWPFFFQLSEALLVTSFWKNMEIESALFPDLDKVLIYWCMWSRRFIRQSVFDVIIEEILEPFQTIQYELPHFLQSSKRKLKIKLKIIWAWFEWRESALLMQWGWDLHFLELISWFWFEAVGSF